MGNTVETAKVIQAALNRRHGSAHWTVKHGRGTAYGWLTICAAPRFCTFRSVEVNGEWQERDSGEGGHSMSPADCETLAKLLGLTDLVSRQGVLVPSSNAYYQEYIDRAEGRAPTVIGKQYWD